MANPKLRHLSTYKGTFTTTSTGAKVARRKNKEFCKRCKKEICGCSHGCKCRTPLR